MKENGPIIYLVGQIIILYSLGIPKTIICKNREKQEHVTMKET